MKVLKLLTILILSVTYLNPRLVCACPPIDGLNDFNCDGKLKFAFIGDSIVAGRGDKKYGGRGGYVRRIKKAFPNARVVGLGYPGYSSGRLLAKMNQGLSTFGGNPIKRQLKNADFVLIDVGRNDYWNKEEAGITARDIVRISRLIQNRIGLNRRRPPFVAIARLLPTTRLYQRTFIAEVNDSLSLLNSSYNVDLNFDKLKARHISFDGIHPTSKGYDSLAKMIRRYIKGPLQKKQGAIYPPDATYTPTATPTATTTPEATATATPSVTPP